MTDDSRDAGSTETAEAVDDDPDAVDAEVNGSVTGVPVEDDDSPRPAKRGHRGMPRVLRNVKIVPAVLVLLLLISGGTATWLYFKQYRPDQQTDPEVARTVVKAASEGTVALLSYSPDSLDKDFATAKSHLTGDFLSYYNHFTEEIVAPAAKEKSLKTNARVMRAAVSELHPDSAVVLVFVDQSTTSKDRPDPSMAASSVLVTMTRVDGKWLIIKFDPV